VLERRATRGTFLSTSALTFILFPYDLFPQIFHGGEVRTAQSLLISGALRPWNNSAFKIYQLLGTQLIWR
jgi:hypothetical protein